MTEKVKQIMVIKKDENIFVCIYVVIKGLKIILKIIKKKLVFN